jgi:hypothetical protein
MLVRLLGADDLDDLVDEDVVGPVDADHVTSYSPALNSTTKLTVPPG